MASTASAAADATKALLASLWQKNLPILADRLNLLQTAAEAAAAGTLTAEQRTDAAGTAHKLAGSLGMFGYPQGTELARELEQAFQRRTALEDKQLVRRMAALRAALPCPDTSS